MLLATGLPPARVRWIVGALLNVVRGSVQPAAESRQAARETGLSEEDWWYSRSALLGELVPDFAERYPLVARLGEGQTPPPSGTGSYLEREAWRSLDAGVELLLDGIETAIAREV